MKQPEKFGKYYLLERINVGGMAEVFKAKSFGVQGFEKLIAIKRILPNIAEDQEFISMFIDEAKIAVQLSHANIAQIFDLGQIDGSYFIALEYVHGKDLRTIWDRLKRRGLQLSLAMSAYITARMCEGLDYAHRKKDVSGHDLNIVHRDVSPQNILVSYDGEVKIIDFGIAKAANKASETQAGILKGKFGYMSPEQVRGLPLDRRSDVFSAGTILFELLTNERLFASESDFSTLEKVRNAQIPPPTSYNSKIPEDLEKIVLQALAKDPADRYRTAYEMQEELQRFLIANHANFVRKDLASHMKQAFKTDIEQEMERNKRFEQMTAANHDDFREEALFDLRRSQPVAPGEGDLLDLSLDEGDEDNVATLVFDTPDAKPGTRPLPPQPKAVPVAERAPAKKRPRVNLIIAALAVIAAVVFGFVAFRYLQGQGLLGDFAALTIRCTPFNAEIRLDNHPVKSLVPKVKAGRHTLEATAEGYQPHREEILVQAGEERTITVLLKKKPAAPKTDAMLSAAQIASNPNTFAPVEVKDESEVKPEAKPEARPEPKPEAKLEAKPKTEAKPKVKPKTQSKATGALRLNSKPWGKVFIDGKDINRNTPMMDHKLSAGWHTITIEFSTGERKTEKVKILPGKTTTKIITTQTP